MSEHWFHERTAGGWNILDENRLLVAYIPDAKHEREDDANLIADAPRLGAEVARIRHGPRGRSSGDETDRSDPGESAC